jgi:hypothetical protein
LFSVNHKIHSSDRVCDKKAFFFYRARPKISRK